MPYFNLSDLDEETFRLMLLTLNSATVMLLLLVSMCCWRLAYRTRFGQASGAPLAGVACGHCQHAIVTEPVRQIALANKGYFVYECRRCGKETLLPTP